MIKASEIMERRLLEPDGLFQNARYKAMVKANKVSNWIRVRKYAREMSSLPPQRS